MINYVGEFIYISIKIIWLCLSFLFQGYEVNVGNTKERMILMAVVKVVELMADSTESWEAATQAAVTEASKTIDNIQSVYVKNFQAVVDNKNITKYRVNVKVSFVVK
jgi:flavin-binding protein dodecin